jgi:hypothetical protein
MSGHALWCFRRSIFDAIPLTRAESSTADAGVLPGTRRSEHDRVLNAKDRAHGLVRVPRHGVARRRGPDLGP